MLELKELAQFFTDELNNIGKTQDTKVEFLVHAELGEQKPRVTCGILRVEEPIISPIDNVLNVNYKGSVEFSVRTPESNFNLINVERIIGILVERFNGKNVEFAKGNGVFNLSFSRAKDFKIEAGVGQMTPVAFSFSINYSENVVVEAKKHWFIKEIGENKKFLEIPFLTERVLVEKDGKINPINDRKYKQAFMMSQQRTYSFTMPYDTSSGIASMLTKDILTGDANKNYILKYYDGVAFTEDEPFLTQVVLYRNGDNGGTKPNTSMLNLLFTDADDGNNSTKYFMALIDNPFDGTTENTRWFDNQTEQIEWYEKRIKVGADFDSIDAPNLNSLVLTSQIYKNSREYDVFDLVNKNYAIIRVEKTVGDEIQKKYYYYKVANANIGANNQVIYDLKLDSVQTWLFREDINIEDSFISKAHLDRWIYNDDGTVTFNGKADSKLFEREEIRDVAKRLVGRKKLKIIASRNAEVSDWLNSNVICWVYVLIGTTKLIITNLSSSDDIEHEFESTWSNYSGAQTDSIDYGYKVLCYPVYRKGGGGIIIQTSSGSKRVLIHGGGVREFVKKNGYSDIHSIKLSVKQPIIFSSSYESMEIVNDNLVITGVIQDDGTISVKISDVAPYSTSSIISPGLISPGLISPIVDLIPEYMEHAFASAKLLTTNDYTLYYGMFDIFYDRSGSALFDLDITMPQITFKKSEIIGKARNKIFNPKLNSMDYKYLRLTFGGNSFDIDIQKLNKQAINFAYNEMITSDITRGILRLYSIEEDGIFNKDYITSFNGFLFSNDLTLPYSIDAFDSFIANNKNAYLSFQAQQNYNKESASLTAKYNTINYGINMSNQAVNLGKSLFSLDFGGAVSSGQQMAVETAQYLSNISELVERTSLDLNYQKTQFDMTIDNMKNAPDTLANANGNAIFTSVVSEFGIYAEIYEGLDTELESANDIMFRDGFNLNRFAEAGKTIKDYCHTRKFFNYIKATLGNISGVAMSDTMRADLKQRFSNGIRFWHQDKIDYSMENYELKLEDGEQDV